MAGLSADRVFFYVVFLLILVITLILIWPFMGAVVLALTMAVVLRPMHLWFTRRMGGYKGPATALTLLSTLLLAIIPVLFGTWLLLNSLSTLSAEVEGVMQDQQPVWMNNMRHFEEWVQSTEIGSRLGIKADDIEENLRDMGTGFSRAVVNWLADLGISVVNMVLPTVVFISLLGTLLTNSDRALQLFKEISPLDDAIDQIFLDRLRIMTKVMMFSIVVVAIVQGLVLGLVMALVGTPHVIPLTVAAMIMAILPGGVAFVGVPVGILHLLQGDIWAGLIVIVGSLTVVSSVANQVRPRMVSKEAYLNRAFMLLSVFSGLALFGFMGVVYGPLIMILFSTMLEVYMKYFRPQAPSVVLSTVEADADEPDSSAQAAPVDVAD